MNRDLARNLVMDRDLVAEGHLDQQALKRTFAHYMTINPGIEIYLLDAEGRILSFSADPGHVKRRRVDLEPIRRFLAGDPEFPLLGLDNCICTPLLSWYSIDAERTIREKILQDIEMFVDGILFDSETDLFAANSDATFMGQLMPIVIVGVFVFVVSWVIWMILAMTMGIRVSPEEEMQGLDSAELGMEAYPEFGKGSQFV